MNRVACAYVLRTEWTGLVTVSSNGGTCTNKKSLRRCAEARRGAWRRRRSEALVGVLEALTDMV